jgi:hypothetical protein
MHGSRLAVLALVWMLAACGAPADRPDAEDPAAGVAGSGNAESAASFAAADVLASEVTLDASVAEAWTGVRIEVSDHSSGDSATYEAELGRPEVLGDTGLTVVAETFLPDFVIDDGVIHNRSTEPHNPAVKVTIHETGTADYRGWLFAAMPGIPPYPHPQYRVTLVEGIPAQPSGE